MASFKAPLESLIFSLLLQGDSGRARESGIGTVFTALAAFLALSGLAFLGAAGFGWLREQYGLQNASLYMGGGALAAGVVAFGIASYTRYVAALKAKTYARVVMSNVQSIVETLTEELEEPIHENPKTAAALAAAAGYVAAQKML